MAGCLAEMKGYLNSLLKMNEKWTLSSVSIISGTWRSLDTTLMCDTLKVFSYLQHFRNILFFLLSRGKDGDYSSVLSAFSWNGSVGKLHGYDFKSTTLIFLKRQGRYLSVWGSTAPPAPQGPDFQANIPLQGAVLLRHCLTPQHRAQHRAVQKQRGAGLAAGRNVWARPNCSVRLTHANT